MLELGRYCAQLKSSPHFQVLVQQFELQIVNHMLHTEPHETKKREGIYASALGVRDFLGNMEAIIAQAVEITDKQKPAPSEYDAQEPETE